MSRKRHEKRASGGRAKAESGGETGKNTPYNAQGSAAEAEAKDEKSRFKRGGRARRKRGGKVDGRRARHRADKPRRSGGRTGGASPLSSAAAVEPRHGMDESGAEKDRYGD